MVDREASPSYKNSTFNIALRLDSAPHFHKKIQSLFLMLAFEINNLDMCHQTNFNWRHTVFDVQEVSAGRSLLIVISLL